MARPCCPWMPPTPPAWTACSRPTPSGRVPPNEVVISDAELPTNLQTDPAVAREAEHAVRRELDHPETGRAAEGVPDQVRRLDLEGLQDVECVEGEVEHVLELAPRTPRSEGGAACGW